MKIGNALGYLFLAAMTVVYVHHNIETKSWVKSTGTIVSTKIEKKSSESKPYRVVIFYSYNVDGLRYSENSTSTARRWLRDARRLEAGYPPGKTIAIIYDPKNPQRSDVKQPGWSGSIDL